MLTDKDINKLMTIFPTRDEVRHIVREELEPMQEMQQSVLSAVDKLATAIETQNLENAARDAQLSRHGTWIHQVADKTEVALKD